MANSVVKNGVGADKKNFKDTMKQLKLDCDTKLDQITGCISSASQYIATTEQRLRTAEATLKSRDEELYFVKTQLAEVTQNLTRMCSRQMWLPEMQDKAAEFKSNLGRFLSWEKKIGQDWTVKVTTDNERNLLFSVQTQTGHCLPVNFHEHDGQLFIEIKKEHSSVNRCQGCFLVAVRMAILEAGNSTTARMARGEAVNSTTARMARGEDDNSTTARIARGEAVDSTTARMARGDDNNSTIARMARGEAVNSTTARMARGEDDNSTIARMARGEAVNSTTARMARGEDDNSTIARMPRGEDNNSTTARMARGEDDH